ncbi:MAG: MG2 domain-containing protein [Acidobacteriota bacterium]
MLPGYREIPEILQNRDFQAAWVTELPETPDFRFHRSPVIPALSEPGLYLIVASSSGDFRFDRASGAELEALYIQVTDLVLLSRDGPRGFEVEVRSGASGRALEGVMVELYRYDYRHGHQRVAQQPTGVEGGTRFNVGSGRNRSYFLMASLANELALDPDQRRVLPQRRPDTTTSSLIYTDRSVYRPGQTISWKVVAYQGVAADGRFTTLPGRSVTVTLADANGESVESVEAKTNGFGSASGRFEVPQGRMLGGWTIQSSIGGYAAVRVEEYKRPSFEVELEASSQELRLNRDGGRMPSSSQMVASGTARVDSDGLFEFSFVPRADEGSAAPEGMVYSYRIRAEVTDEGGETRVAERSIRLGFVAVAAQIDSETSFFSAEARPRFTISRTDLDGLPRSGTGAWSLRRLCQPSEVLLPAEQPLPEPLAGDTEFQTPGDRLRPRWEPGYDPAQVLRLWSDGDELAQGRLIHDQSGIAEVETAALAPGAYRLRYQTQDSFGAVFETQHEFVVAGTGTLPLALPGLLLPAQSSVGVGRDARILVHTALDDQQVSIELFRDGTVFKRFRLANGSTSQVLEISVDEGLRGGFGIRLTLLRDHQLILLTRSVMVPWDDRRLELSFSSFRDRIRPGQSEKWRVTVAGADGRAVDSEAAELLAYMYDRSLDLFAPHEPPRIEALYPSSVRFDRLSTSLGMSHAVWRKSVSSVSPVRVRLHGDRLRFFDGYPIGGPGRGGKGTPVYMAHDTAIATEEVLESKVAFDEAAAPQSRQMEGNVAPSPSPAETEVSLRTDFAETACWRPHLLLDESGSVAFEVTVPASVTGWDVWVHALTTDLRGGSLQRQTQSVKDLMVRPYLPRFLRGGDRVQLRVAVNNASDHELEGELDLDLEDPDTGSSLLSEFGLTPLQAHSVPFTVSAGGAMISTFEIDVPARLGAVAIQVRARAGDVGDGEAHLLPVLPGRIHLSQSRFVALRNGDRRSLGFEDLQDDSDPSLRHEQLVITLDAQLFYGVLKALPYLAVFPYECTEQTLNRFLSAGIVSSLYDSYPGVAAMAEDFSRRETQTEPWGRNDPNLAMSLEETPWLVASRGGDGPNEDLINVLDPAVSRAEMRNSFAKLQEAQTVSGGFPWWPGGPPSPYMTLYLLRGLSRALEFEIQVPKPLVVDAWRYLHAHFVDEIADRLPATDCCWEMVTFLNYVLSAYPDTSWTGDVFSDEDRRVMLDFSFRHWQEHSPLLKSYLALTLARFGRLADARLVFASVMDSAKSSRDEGVFWAPEDRAWLWYNDTIETHAFALRTLLELDPGDDRRHGLVQWLFLNKKLNHWESTRATAEVVYALVKYLEQEDFLAVEERAVVDVGGQSHTFVFEPGVYTGKGNRVVLESEELEAAVANGTSEVVVEKDTPGFLFTSATWHFSTERLPKEAEGDLFAVERSYFKRQATEDGYTLAPIGPGSRIQLGDQIEVQLVLRAKSEAEYVHLRDPRGAGFEPDSVRSGYRWDLGIAWYEEIRDSGTNFFIENLPVGEFTLRYRLRAATAGAFRTGPAIVQSMYAPEFSAYSSGFELEIEP